MGFGKETTNCGVSVDFLVDFNDRLFKGIEAPGVQLFVCTRDSFDFEGQSLQLRRGETVQFIYEVEADQWYGYVPNKGEGVFDARLVRPKVREEWTIQDVVEHVIKPVTVSSSSSSRTATYVDTMKQSLVGQPFKGVMVRPESNATPFRNLVHSMASLFDRVEKAEDRYIWLDMFCAAQNHYQQSSSLARESEINRISAKFSTRVHYYAAPALKSTSKSGVQSIMLRGVFVEDKLATLCLDYGLVEGITRVLAHVRFLQMILNVHAAVFGEAIGDATTEKSLKKKGFKKGFSKSKVVSGLKTPFMTHVVNKSKKGKKHMMMMDKKGKGKGKKGKKMSAIGDVLELTPEEVLTNNAIMDVLSGLLPEEDRPELAQQDYLNSILSNTSTL